MTNGDRIRTLTDQELAFDLGLWCRAYCGDCPAVLYPGGYENPCPAFRAAQKKAQERAAIPAPDFVRSCIDSEACAAHMEKWLQADIEEVTIE